MTLYFSIAREHSEPRFRAKIHQQPGGPAIFITARKSGSVTLAKREAENVFGELAWVATSGQTWDGHTREIAVLEIED